MEHSTHLRFHPFETVVYRTLEWVPLALFGLPLARLAPQPVRLGLTRPLTFGPACCRSDMPYVRCAREQKRLESVTKSPLFAFFAPFV